jgi:hypothetical protein
MHFGLYFFGLFKLWIETMFVLPFRNLDMLWLLVPVWLTWFFSEFFQEKSGTSLGNAITNAVLIVWGSIDCARQTANLISQKVIHDSLPQIIARFGLLILLFTYGFIIIRLGIRGNPLVKKIGRVRVVTYVFAMFVPIFYNAIQFSLEHFLATLIFFPLFYFTIELLDRVVPDPKAIQEDKVQSSVIHNTTPSQPASHANIMMHAAQHSRQIHQQNRIAAIENHHPYHQHGSSSYPAKQHQTRQQQPQQNHRT